MKRNHFPPADLMVIEMRNFFMLSTKQSITTDFPKEIVDERRRLVPFLKDAKENGQVAKLIYNKLYINGQRFKPQTVSTSEQ